MRQFFLALGCVVFFTLSASTLHAQTQTPTAINPLTGPSFPCPKPEDPLAQLFCTSPQLALLDMQFVKTYNALHQQIGPAGDEALRKEDIQLELTIRSQCGIALPQGNSPTPPPPAPPGSDQCVIAAYQQQIGIWKSRLYGAAAEEANRSIPDQIALQARLQELGFLPAQAQLDSVFGSGTRAAIIQWQNSVGRPPTGILGDADAQALLSNSSAPLASPQGQDISIAQALAINPVGTLFGNSTTSEQLGPNPSIEQSLQAEALGPQVSSQPQPPMSNNAVGSSPTSNSQSTTQPDTSQQPTPESAPPVAQVSSPPSPPEDSTQTPQDSLATPSTPSSHSFLISFYDFFSMIFDDIESFFARIFHSPQNQPTNSPPSQSSPPSQNVATATTSSPDQADGNAAYQQACSGITSLSPYAVQSIVSSYAQEFAPLVGSGSDALNFFIKNGGVSFTTIFAQPHTCTLQITVSGDYNGNSYNQVVDAIIDPIKFEHDPNCTQSGIFAMDCSIERDSEQGVFLNEPPPPNY